MGSALLLIALMVCYGLHCNFQVLSVGLHHLNGLPRRKFIFLFNPAPAQAVRFFHGPQVGVALYIGAAVIYVVIRSGLAEVKASGKPAVGAFSNFFPVPRQILPVHRRILQIIINCPAVGPGDSGHIESCFHPSLYLETVDSGIHHLRNILHHAQVLGVEYIGAPLILIYRHIFSRSGLLHKGIFPAAGVGAGALVGIPSHKVIA